VGVSDASTTQGAPFIAAVVQGGGPRGLRAVFADADAVFRRHVDASDLVKQPVQLVLWPEDVIDLEEPLAGTPEEAAVADVARRLHATVVAGIVEDDGPEHFRNASVVWDPDGNVIARYDKAHRVPFGEYVPGRDLIKHVVDLSIIPRDAIPGRGAGLVRTPVGRLGVLISYEVFFANRARSAVQAGGEILLVPTNAASYKTSQVPTQELAAARLRAVETGREVLQAGPTGYSAFIDDRGRLRTRTTLGRQEVRQGIVHRRHGRTPYVVTGDFPVLLASALLLGGGWAIGRTRRRGPENDTLEQAEEAEEAEETCAEGPTEELGNFTH
jgi:apolipoprotein N-acyltransferase